MMKQKLTYYICTMLVVAGFMTACTEEITPPTPIPSEGRVVLRYTIGGSSTVTTRAQEVTPEPGNTGRNENLVDHLDLFIFRADGTYVDHYGSPVEYNFDENYNGETYKTWEIPYNEISPNEIEETDQVYLVANCASVADITTLDGLKAAEISNLVCYDKQTTFVMDGKGKNITKTGNNVTIEVDLTRAAAKVRLTFAANKDREIPQWDDVSYRFCNYATTSKVIAMEEEAEYTYVNALTLANYPSATEFATDITPIADDPNDENKKYLVLYAYANNWHDGDATDDKLNVEAPINDERETRILLQAPYKNELYYYDIPVNFRLPTNNDDINITFEDYKDLYRLQRNYIYDITVTIDREGGTESEPVTPKLYYQVLPFDNEEINIPAFK